MVTVCCVCNKTRTSDGWVQCLLPEHEPASHGYCPVCNEEVLKELNRFITLNKARQGG